MEERKSDPGMAAVLSFIFSGLGQIYNGQIKKGLFVIFLSCLNMIFCIIGAVLIIFWMLNKIIFSAQLISGVVLFLIGLFFICILGIWNINDAYKVANR